MEAIREIVEVKSHKLQFTLPENFNEQIVEMILLPLKQEKQETEKKKIKNVRGALKKYANPNLVEQEAAAWKDAIEEKYAVS